MELESRREISDPIWRADGGVNLRRIPWGLWGPTAALLGLLWLLIFNQQRLEWAVNVVYAYGWAVPALALFLLWERWKTRPAAVTPPPVGVLLTLGGLLLA